MTYRATAAREGRWWAVTVPGLPGVYTQGRNWTEAREMARDAIATLLDVDADEVSVDLVPELPDHAETVLDELAQRREEKKAAERAEADALRDAALRLTRAGVTVRDAGAMLGISYQRVSQLTNATG